jgi:hypothetical protein
MEMLRRFVSRAWLVAAPLIIISIVVVVIPTSIGLIHQILQLMFRREVADTLLMDAGIWLVILASVATTSGLVLYAAVCLVRWAKRKKRT